MRPIVLPAVLLATVACSALAGDRAAPPRAYYPTGYFRQPVDPANPAPAPGLGTFYPSASLMAAESYPVGVGYAGTDTGQNNMSLYGPLSALRAKSVIVPTYTRGYDGRTYVGQGVTFSYPNLPPASPFVYPTQMSRTPGFRTVTIPPGWPRAVNWIDQN